MLQCNTIIVQPQNLPHTVTGSTSQQKHQKLNKRLVCKETSFQYYIIFCSGADHIVSSLLYLHVYVRVWQTNVRSLSSGNDCFLCEKNKTKLHNASAKCQMSEGSVLSVQTWGPCHMVLRSLQRLRFPGGQVSGLIEHLRLWQNNNDLQLAQYNISRFRPVLYIVDTNTPL